MNRYFAAVPGDPVKAMELYEHNVALSEALYGYLHGLEVALSNALHHELTQAYNTPRWYDRAPLNDYHKDKVRQAKDDAGQNATTGKIIAELSFSFWTGLIAKQYHASLWTPYLRKAFPNQNVSRSYFLAP